MKYVSIIIFVILLLLIGAGVSVGDILMVAVWGRALTLGIE